MASSPTVIPSLARGSRIVRPVTRLFSALAAAGLIATLLPVPVGAADGPTMSARVMFDGHARVGAWMAIAVRVRNDGPAIVGELRIAGGAQGRTRFATPVDLPTNSDKTFQLYAQPPAFGAQIDVTLVEGDRTVAKQAVAFRVHDATQLVVGVVAEKPQGIVSKLDLPPDQRGIAPAVVALSPDDLPERVQAWGPLDRLVWQDVDSASLSPEQVAALRGWLAAGGRLVVVGGTSGPAALSGLPDDILPFRPASTIDVAPASLAGLIGQARPDAADVPALSGELARGRALASSGNRAIAAEASYGAGMVTIVGFDPTTDRIGASKEIGGLWRRLLPARTNSAVVTGDDGQLVQAVTQLPSLALPPIGGLLVLLGGYILLVGPLNYLILRRLDRREWAWVTMPLLILAFAAGAYGFGAALRGLDVIVNEVSIVRGAQGATEGTAQVYLGVFSPSRGTYQLEVPGGALLTSTISGDLGSGGQGAGLDIVQGDPARVRDLTVGFGSLRTVRAESSADVPRIEGDLRLEGGTLKGRIRNLSDQTLERPAVVLGGSVVVLGDLAPDAEQTISLPIRPNQFGQSLSDRILGQVFYGDPARGDDRTQRNLVRHAVLDQLTFDPNFGTSIQLDSETPVLLAWGTDDVLDVRIEGQVPRRIGNVLYYVPLRLAIGGPTVFGADLVRSSVVESDAMVFSKDPSAINFGQGSVTMAYRPITFDGTLTATRVLLGMNWSGGPAGPNGSPSPIEPVAPSPAPSAQPSVQPTCDPNLQPCDQGWDGVPEVEVFDRQGAGSWRRLPHFAMNASYELAHPERYVDATTGGVLVRFVNDRQETVSFTFQVTIEGTVR